jgi:hypothetical protein
MKHVEGGILWTLDKGDVDFKRAEATKVELLGS